MKKMVQCERCDQGIRKGEGVIIQGNIYMVEGTPDDLTGGLIGPAFTPDEKDRVYAEDIRTIAFCWGCLIETLDMPRRLTHPVNRTN